MNIVTRLEFTVPQFKAIEAAAHAAGRTVEAWCEEKTLAAARAAAKPPAKKHAGVK
jgi:hypothetical protein